MSASVSRRWFIGGLAATGALGSHRLFATPVGAFAGGVPRLRFGVVTDVHMRMADKAGTFAKGYGPEILVKAFSYFRDQGVDAVLVPGDLADRGRGEELKAVADAFWTVFPDGKAPDGHKVEPIFTLGNHDWSGLQRMSKVFPDKAEREAHALVTNPKKWWREAFHEDWFESFRKDIKGYTFFAAHWCKGGDSRGKDEVGCDVFSELVSSQAPKLDPKVPFFFAQHPHPKDTCYGPWAGGQDNGAAVRALAPYPNVLAFSGHSHYSLTDERSVWQGAFTSIGCGCLRYTGLGPGEFKPFGYENSNTAKKSLDAQKVLPKLDTYDCHQGMLVSVFDDRVVCQRREFGSDLSLGDDWVIPLGDDRPFAFVERARKSRAPQFPAGAVLKRSEAKIKNRAGVETESHILEFPQALAEGTARPRRYEIKATVGPTAKVFQFLAPGYNHSLAHPKAKGECVFKIAKTRCPAGPVMFTVTPVSSLGLCGRPIQEGV